MTVAALPNFGTVKDLVPDLGPMFETHRDMAPYLVREDVAEQDDPTREYRQAPAELERYLQFSYCIKCGCCMAACPTVATDPHYAGPMPLGRRPSATTATRATVASASGARCCPAGVGRGAATSPGSARRSARRGWTRPRRSSS